MSQARRRVLAGLALAAGSLASGPAPVGAEAEAAASSVAPVPEEPWVLITRELEAVPLRLEAITPESIRGVGAEGSSVDVERSRVLALINPEVNIEPPASGVLRLIDGSRLPGAAVVAGAAAEEGLSWRNAWLGLLQVPLERIESVSLRDPVPPPPPAVGDVVALNNGDVVEGFIVALADPLVIEREGVNLEIPLERVAAARLVNAPVPPPAGAVRVWYRNGTVADLTDVVYGGDRLLRLREPALRPSTLESTYGEEDVAGLLFAPREFVPLAGLDATEVEGPPTRYLVPEPDASNTPAPLDLVDVLFRGPLLARYRVEGASRFAATLELPARARAWGDCEVVLREEEREVYRVRLNAVRPTAEVNVPLSGGEFSIEITEGANGPVFDRVRFRRAAFVREAG